MTREETFALTAKISALITRKNPCIPVTEREIKNEANRYSRKDLVQMRELGLYFGDFTCFYVIRAFLSMYGILDLADDAYVSALFANAKRLDADAFLQDAYIRTVRFPPVTEDDITFSYAEYDRCELFLYDEPDLKADCIVPKIGFFTKKVGFPSVYEGEMPWMSVCPSEVFSMKEDMAAAHGDVLVLGLGLGYYPFIIAQNPAVRSISIVEKNPIILRLFQKYLFPQFRNKEKIRLIEADAIAYMDTVKNGDFDYCFADIWEGVVDGAPLYQKIRAHEARLAKTEMRYWIQPQLDAYLEQSDLR